MHGGRARGGGVVGWGGGGEGAIMQTEVAKLVQVPMGEGGEGQGAPQGQPEMKQGE